MWLLAVGSLFQQHQTGGGGGSFVLPGGHEHGPLSVLCKQLTNKSAQIASDRPFTGVTDVERGRDEWCAVSVDTATLHDDLCEGQGPLGGKKPPDKP